MNTILIVEDSPIIRQPIEAALNRSGYRTMAAENGAAALALVDQERPDLILLDLAMPVMDGLAMLTALRTRERSANCGALPVIVLSAIAEKARVVEAARLGISAYLLKSRFSLQEMLDLIARTLTTTGQNVKETEHNVSVEEQRGLDPSRAPAPPAQPSQLDRAADSADDLASLKPVLSRSEVTQRLENCGELKGLSPAVAQVLKLTSSPRCSIEQVARAIGQDHAMALKILKLANSAVYTRGEPVDSIQTAVTRIGLGQIRQTVLNISVIDHFRGPNTSEAEKQSLHFGQFWEHAVATGIIAAEITRQRDAKEVDSAFTMGLLHDVGRMYFAEQLGGVYDHVVEAAQRLALPLEQVESRMLLYNHADIMDRVLHSWKFPKQLINPIVYHHLSAGNIRRNAPRQIEEVATLALANRLAHAMMLGSSGNEAIYPTEELCELLKLEPKVIEAITAPAGGAREESDRVKFAILLNSGGADWPQLRQIHQDELSAPLKPLYMSASPHSDAYRIFCDELSQSPFEKEGADQPNLGIIHLTNVRDRVPLTTAYRSAEAEAGVSGLPLLVLSPAGKILPENSLLVDRRHEALATPFVIPRFISAVNRLIGSVGGETIARAA